MSRNIFEDSTYENNMIDRNIFCLKVWEKMIEYHGARTFLLAVSHGANTFLRRCLPWALTFS